MALLLAKRIEPVLLYVGGTAYFYYLVLRLRKGLPRFLALLPLLPVCHLVAWTAPTPVERAMCCVLFLWCFMFKLMLVAWDKGGLAAANSSARTSFPRFLVSLAVDRLQQDPPFPRSKQEEDLKRRDAESDKVVLSNGHEKSISHSEPEKNLRRRGPESEEIVSLNGHEQSGAAAAEEKSISQATGAQPDEETKKSPGKNSPGWLWKMATAQALHVVLIRDLLFYIVNMSLLWMLLTRHEVISEYVVDLSIALITYFSLSLLFDVGVAVPASIVGREVEPVMDMPFLSKSLGEFWGRRWNLVVINLGRVSLYEPICKFLSRGKKRSSLVDQAIASQAVFLVSGLMHELAIFYALKTRPSWEMTTFFVVNGLGILVERMVMKNMRHSFELPRFLRWAYTFAFLFFTGHWFFCPPCRVILVHWASVLLCSMPSYIAGCSR